MSNDKTIEDHSPEPWEIGDTGEGRCRIWSGRELLVAKTNISSHLRDVTCRANARRIVACVNKFADLSTEEIEALPANVGTLLSRLSQRSLECDQLTAERDQLRGVCAEAYQFAGAYDAPVEVLDNLSAAANGWPLPHESFLPVDDSKAVAQRDQLLAALEELEHQGWFRYIVSACEKETERSDLYAAVTQARAAIAAVKGGAA